MDMQMQIYIHTSVCIYAYNTKVKCKCKYMKTNIDRYAHYHSFGNVQDCKLRAVC